MDELFGNTSDPFGENVASSAEDRENAESVDAECDEYESPLQKGRIEYMPAIDAKVSGFFRDSNIDLNVGSRRLTWWEEDSLVPTHPFVLINPVVWGGGSDGRGFGDDVTGMANLRPRDDHFVFADSGGFQIVAEQSSSEDEINIVRSPDLHSFAEGSIYPPKLLEWQARNASAGAILDHPPFGGDAEEKGVVRDSYDAWKNEMWKPCLEKTKRNVRSMVERFEEIGDVEYTMYGVAHGVLDTDSQNPAHLWTDWMNELEEIYDFNAYCLGGVPGKPAKTPMIIHAVYQNKPSVEHMHVLGTGSTFQRIVMSYYLQLNDDIAMTMDSSSFTVGSRYRQMISPVLPESKITVTSREPETTEPVRPDRYPCRCAVCSAVADEYGERFLLEENSANASLAMDTHNLHMMLQEMHTFDALIESEGVALPERADPYEGEFEGPFWNHASEMFSQKKLEEIWDTMRFTRMMVTEGIESALERYVVPNRLEADARSKSIKPRTTNSFDEWS